MKKLLFIFIALFLLVGCEEIPDVSTSNLHKEIYGNRIICDESTGIAYIKNRTYQGYMVITPYYDSDGTPMKCHKIR